MSSITLNYITWNNFSPFWSVMLCSINYVERLLSQETQKTYRGHLSCVTHISGREWHDKVLSYPVYQSSSAFADVTLMFRLCESIHMFNPWYHVCDFSMWLFSILDLSQVDDDFGGTPGKHKTTSFSNLGTKQSGWPWENVLCQLFIIMLLCATLHNTIKVHDCTSIPCSYALAFAVTP